MKSEFLDVFDMLIFDLPFCADERSVVQPVISGHAPGM